MPGIDIVHTGSIPFLCKEVRHKYLSGHFHQKSEFANIRYLGSQMQFTWSDYGDNKYFHVFDTDTQELTPVLNPIEMFEKVFYDDTKETFESIANADYSNVNKKFVKVIVVNKDNPYWFDTFSRQDTRRMHPITLIR